MRRSFSSSVRILWVAAVFPAMSLSPQGSSLLTVNVRTFGATGDGATDDTAAINRAMSSCTDRPAPGNGCVLYFPAGIYITTGLAIASYVHMKGDGWGSSVLQLKPNTLADVLTIPVNAFNFSVYGLTLDGNSRRRGRGNCFATAVTSTGPAAWNTANKQTAQVSAQKWGHVEEVMFSNCSQDGIHINLYNYSLFFNNFYAYNNGVYGLYTQGTNSGFSNFQIEHNGTAGIHVANANNRFVSGEVMWNGAADSNEAAVFVAGQRNIISAIETEDNYTNGFADTGIDNTFVACVSDSDGYAKRNTNASSQSASGFVLAGSGGTFIADKVTSYRGRLQDGNFTTQWPYTLKNSDQSRIDISYDSTNRPPPVIAGIPEVVSPAAGHGACIKSAGPPVLIGSCSTALNASGACTCN